jgi:hypothetical protein
MREFRPSFLCRLALRSAFLPALLFVAVAAPALARDAPTSTYCDPAELSTVPPSLVLQSERAMAAWRDFQQTADRLRELQASGLIVSARDKRFRLMDEDWEPREFRRYLYPWACARPRRLPAGPVESSKAYPELVALDARVHLVEAHGGGSPDGRDVTVRIAKTAGPTLLVLAGGYGVRYHIKRDPGARLLAVAHTQAEKQTLEFDTGEPVREVVLEEPPYLSMLCDIGCVPYDRYRDSFDQVRQATGKPLSTWQGREDESEYVVDGIHHDQPWTPVPAVAPIVMQTTQDYYGKPVPQMLTVQYDRNTHLMHAPSMRIWAKWYWEVQYHAGAPDTELLDRVGIAMGNRSQTKGDDITELPPQIIAAIEDGDVIRFALDLDDGTLWIGLNDLWVQGGPQSDETAVSVQAGRYRPPLFQGKRPRDTARAPRYTFDFGATPFRYDMPAGYLPYDLRFFEQRQVGVIASSSRASARKSAVTRAVDRLRKMPPPLLANFRAMAAEWERLRDAACAVTGDYFITGGNRPRGEYAARRCALEFDAALLGLATRIDKRLASVEAGAAILPKFDGGGLRLHYVGFDYPSNGRGLAGTTPVAVDIHDTRSPLVLVLDAREGIQWRIRVARGVRLRHVIVHGGRTPEIELIGLRGGAVPVSIFSDAGGSGYAFRRAIPAPVNPVKTEAVADALEKTLGLRPVSVRMQCPRDHCDIDGSAAVVPPLIEGERTVRK